MNGIIKIFASKNDLNLNDSKLTKVKMKPNDIKKIAVLGAGVMGHSIALIAAMAGYNVVLRDIEQKLLDNAHSSIKKSLDRFYRVQKTSDESRELVLSRINMTLEMDEAVKDAQLIIEAVPEVMKLKHLVWKEISEKAPRDAVFASNTSSLSISKISEVVDNPERFIGMHFFNPPTHMKLVEVNSGVKTKRNTVDIVEKIAKKMKKIPIWVKKDSPGFIVNRILITYLNEAAKMLDTFNKEQIDAAMQHIVGMPLGPFMLCDLIGLDIVYKILKIFEESIDIEYAPDVHITRLFNANKLGRKTGEGFYTYQERPLVIKEQAKGFDVKNLLIPLIMEAEKVVNEGISDRKSVDYAMKLGANFPKGPFEIKEEMK
jgi:enoyl-CoA hydratase/3-hydroxyacyl-CoA dehydrogenase